MSRPHKGRRKWRKNIRINEERKFAKNQAESRPFLTSRQSSSRQEFWQSNSTNTGNRQLDFYQNVNGIDFLIYPEEIPISPDLLSPSSDFGYFGQRHNRHELSEEELYTLSKDKRGFLTRKEAEYIAPQIEQSVQASKTQGMPQCVLVEFPESYQEKRVSTNQAYVEISGHGFVQLPRIKTGEIIGTREYIPGSLGYTLTKIERAVRIKTSDASRLVDFDKSQE